MSPIILQIHTLPETASCFHNMSVLRISSADWRVDLISNPTVIQKGCNSAKRICQSAAAHAYLMHRLIKRKHTVYTFFQFLCKSNTCILIPIGVSFMSSNHLKCFWYSIWLHDNYWALAHSSVYWFTWGDLLTHLPGQNGPHFADDIFICVFVNGKLCIFIRILLKFVPKDPIDN